jgi:[CysO sulfur-carrier protein]-S-L-cysteine hydrolase
MIELDPVFAKEIVEHGLREFPNEACGLLAGRNGSAVKVFAMRNADASPATYTIDSRELLAAMNDMVDQGQDLVGIYHTHTHSEAYPSETDRIRAGYPEAYHLIVSLADRKDPVLRAFRIDDGQVIEEELTIR